MNPHAQLYDRSIERVCSVRLVSFEEILLLNSRLSQSEKVAKYEKSLRAPPYVETAQIYHCSGSRTDLLSAVTQKHSLTSNHTCWCRRLSECRVVVHVSWTQL
jgi:hypothetical protein